MALITIQVTRTRLIMIETILVSAAAAAAAATADMEASMTQPAIHMYTHSPFCIHAARAAWTLQLGSRNKERRHK